MCEEMSESCRTEGKIDVVATIRAKVHPNALSNAKTPRKKIDGMSYMAIKTEN